MSANVINWNQTWKKVKLFSGISSARLKIKSEETIRIRPKIFCLVSVRVTAKPVVLAQVAVKIAVYVEVENDVIVVVPNASKKRPEPKFLSWDLNPGSMTNGTEVSRSLRSSKSLFSSLPEISSSLVLWINNYSNWIIVNTIENQLTYFRSGTRKTLLSISSVSSSWWYIRLPMSRCDRRRRPFDGEQTFRFDVDVVQVVDLVNTDT